MRPHLYIAGMGRSGSTLLANWLTEPNSQIVFCEPNFFSHEISVKLNKQFIDFGLSLKGINLDQTQDTQEWLRKLTGEQLQGRKWGFKEVLGESHLHCLEELQPEFIIISVRNIRDIFLSFIEKHQTQNNENRFPGQWSLDYCMEESVKMVDFVERLKQENQPHIVSRYEDFVNSPEKRQEIENASGWHGGGNLSRHLALFDRKFEQERHKGKLSMQVRNNMSREIDLKFFAMAEALVKSCQRYQMYFNYS